MAKKDHHQGNKAELSEEDAETKIDVITYQVNKMKQRISEPPRLLSSSAGNPSCSIFRAPQSLSEANGEVYHPRIVSVGPYHKNGSGLKMIEEHKWRYLGALLARLRASGGPRLEELLSSVAGLEARARECYAEEVPMGSGEFCQTLVLDSCFVVELFRKADGIVGIDSGDPVFNTAWIVPFLYKDLLRLENQIPFLVLHAVFELTGGDGGNKNLCHLALRFFNHAMRRPEEAIKKCLGSENPEPKHLLDLIRLSLIPPNLLGPTRPRNTPAHVIHCVSKLRRAGIKLREPSLSDPTSFLAVRFRRGRGILEMPGITVDDFWASFLQNVVAFEQCHNQGRRSGSVPGQDISGDDKHFTAYATLLDCLVNTYRDVEYLCDNNIIENCYGNDQEVAKFVNNLGRDVAFDIDACYLADLFDEVHSYYKNSWHVQWAGFKYTYFDTPWSFISALAALVLLLLTIAQTLYTVFGFYASNSKV